MKLDLHPCIVQLFKFAMLDICNEGLEVLLLLSGCLVASFSLLC